jgi:hypothetical protein
MPDWITHIAVAYSLALLAGVRRYELVILGALLPDLFKLFLPLGAVIGYGESFFLGNYFAPFHTFFGVLLTSALLSTFFAKAGKVFPLFLLGAFSHLAMDSLLYPYGYDNWVFWPLLRFGARGVAWPDNLLLPLAAVSIALLLSFYRGQLFSKLFIHR